METPGKHLTRREYVSAWNEHINALYRLRWNLDKPDIEKLDRIVGDLRVLVAHAVDRREIEAR